MFRTNNCSSSGGLYKQITVFFHATYKVSSRWQDMFAIKHILSATAEINYLKKKVCISLVFLTCEYDDARSREHKVESFP